MSAPSPFLVSRNGMILVCLCVWLVSINTKPRPCLHGLSAGRWSSHWWVTNKSHVLACRRKFAPLPQTVLLEGRLTVVWFCRVGTTVHHALHYPLIPLWFYVELLSIQIASTLLEYNKQLSVEYEVANTFHGWKFPFSEHKRSSFCSPQSHPFTHLTTNTWVFHFFCLSLTALHFQGLYKTVSSYIQQKFM